MGSLRPLDGAALARGRHEEPRHAREEWSVCNDCRRKPVEASV
jgi:hypothetical protein